MVIVVTGGPEMGLDLKEFHESGINLIADSVRCQRKTDLYYDSGYKFNRDLVLATLKQYVKDGLSVSKPVKCVDVLGGAGINGLLWKKHLGDSVDVLLNCANEASSKTVDETASRNSCAINVVSKDPCVLLHEQGFSFLYLDCTTEASQFFDAAFRNLSRNGVLVITAKDDSCLHGGTYDVALRRYGGRIMRTCYANELGVRLFIGAMARTAARYNKSFKVLYSTVYKSSFTVAILSRKGPTLANESLSNLRLLKHCMSCEERAFYPAHEGFPIDSTTVKLNCHCESNAPGIVVQELGPLWSGNIFDVAFLGQLLDQPELDVDARLTLDLMLEESRCSSDSDDRPVKKPKLNQTSSSSSTPPFYYNLHKHHPGVAQLVKIPKVVDELRRAGYRASRTHFDPLAIRTNAPLNRLMEIVDVLSPTNNKT